MLTRRLAVVLVLAVGWPHTAVAQTPRAGREMYQAWCASCHAGDGTGRAAARPVPTPPPDFTDCRLTTRESDLDWQFVIRRGGAAAGLSADMPAFETLTSAEAGDLVAYLRAFCVEPGWPSGNFNLPRALFTAKAFPDSEVALEPMVSHAPTIDPYAQLQLAYALRLGRRVHAEVSLPFETVHWVTGRVSGIGDLGLEGSFVVNPGARRRPLVAAGLKTTFPTGDRRWSFGEGTTVFEPFLAAATTWRSLYLQADLRGRFLARRLSPEDPTRLVLYNVAVSRDLGSDPTSWTIGVELNGLDRSLAITPEVRKGLTRTGSLAAAFGVQVPVRLLPRQYYGTVRWTGYLLWDYLETARRRRAAVR